ncbi:MAG: YegS/Rv2252/BmrU family lipid kinase [Chlorobia bacterium]|nr:YegS/Rv2252/BmrU family lipid kinase [Fimbriimonadaceae bacterium]
MSQTAALIVNGKSRRGREWFAQAENALKEAGIELSISKLLKDPRQISPIVKDAIAKNTPLVCVGGGDGTFSAVAQHFIGKESILGVLPLGTGNSLARDLGINANVEEAVKTVIEGRVEHIDLGKVNNEYFVNVATIGLTTRIAEGLDDAAKKRFGRAVYLFAIIKAVASASPFRVSLTIEGKEHSFRSFQVVVGSGRYHGGPFPVTPEASIESGKLAGYVLTSTRRSVLLKYGINLWLKRQTEMPEVFQFEAETLMIKTIPVKRITIDGEIKIRTPGEFKILPAAIKVMAPNEK